MSKRIAVVISEDPSVTARPVEALRIALGLCAGDHETTVILLGRSPDEGHRSDRGCRYSGKISSFL